LKTDNLKTGAKYLHTEKFIGEGEAPPPSLVPNPPPSPYAKEKLCKLQMQTMHFECKLLCLAIVLDFGGGMMGVGNAKPNPRQK